MGLWDDTEDKKLSENPLKWRKAQGHENEEVLWEPGCSYNLEGFRIKNNGNLALKYRIQITGIVGDNELKDAIDFTYQIGTAALNLNEEGHLKAGEISDVISINGKMKESAGNEYQNKSIDGIAITVYATQDTVENDSYGPTYDENATYYPVLDAAGLKDALVNGGNIKVDSSFDAGNDTLAVNKDTVLDMNGKTISNTADIWDESKADWSLISARNGAKLTITGNGTFKAKENDSFTVDVQDGATVTIEDGTFIGNIHAVYVYEGTANIKGGFYAVQQKYTDANKADGFVLNCYDANRTNGTAKIIVTGGTFVNFNPADCWAEGEHTNFVADGYGVVATPQANGDVWYTVVKKSADGETFGSGTHTLSTGITATNANAVAVKAESGANITITGGAYDGGKGGNNVCVWANTGSTVTIKDGTFTVGGDADENGNSVIYSTGGDITIEGGFFYTNYSYRDKYYVLNQQNNNPGTITVKGGTFVNYNPAGGDDYVQPTNFVADGYKVVTETHGEDTWYTVVAE